MSISPQLAKGISDLMKRFDEPQARVERGFFVHGGSSVVTACFSGLYTSLQTGSALCYSVVDDKDEVVGYDFRGSPTRCFNANSLDKSDMCELAKRIPDGPTVSQIETSEPHGLVGEGYPNPAWKPGTVCIVDKNKKLVFKSTVAHSALQDMVMSPSGIAFGSVLVGILSGSTPAPAPAKKLEAPRAKSSGPPKKRRT